MTVDLAQFLAQGKGRDAIEGFNPQFAQSLSAMFAAAPPEIQKQLQISSGFRTPERQAQLWQEALKKYGSESAARKWVAPPGHSNHNHGVAADLRYLNPAALDWAHKNAGNFGLAFPLSNENWHIELESARGGKPAAMPPAMMAAAGQPTINRQALAAAVQQQLAAMQPQQPDMLDSFAQAAPALSEMFQPDPEDMKARAAAERARKEALFVDPFA